MAPPRSIAPTPGHPHKTNDHIIAHSTKATTACSSCQKRKIRCIGGIPCLPCQNAKVDCVSNLENDGRRKITLKRKIEALEQDRNLLMQLVDTIREDNKETCPSVLNLIRSNAPLDEIKSYLAESLDQSNDDNTPLKRQESVGSSASTPRNVMDVKRICDTPIHPVPAQPWTSVSNDDALVSHLISLHFTWNGITLNWIDRDLFLRDMRSGNLDAKFCSPLLVNSILAMACLYSDWPEALAVPGDPSTRGAHFLEETMRLMKEEEGRLTLTNLQARGNIFICLTGMGKDRLGWFQLVDIVDCLRETEKIRQSMIRKAGEEAPEMTRVISTVIFGLFNMCTISVMSLQKHPIIKRPILLERLPRDHDPNDTWSPYPRQAVPQPAHTNCVINGLIDLTLIVWEICDYFFGDNKPEIFDLEKVNAFHYRLQNWADILPKCISLGCNAVPGVMDMHMRYYTITLALFGYVEANMTKGDLESKSRIKALKLDAAHNIGTLINLFRLEWPAECVPGTAMQYCSVAMFTLLGNLDDAQNKQAFVECFIVLRALARRWQLAKGILRLIQLTAMKMKSAHPTETEILFKDFEADLWKVEDPGKFSSLYPNFSVAVNQHKGSDRYQEEAELDQFLASWDNINLSETVMEQATEARDASNDSSSGNSRK